jgi:hypothetical protein
MHPFKLLNPTSNSSQVGIAMKQLIDLVQVLVFNLTTPCRQEVPQEGGVCIRSYIYVYMKGGI